MRFEPTAIDGVTIVRRDGRSDARGRFSRLYCVSEFAAAGLNTDWVQSNHSMTLGAGSVRGMHFQRPPHAETKLVSCTAGRAYDVAVDLRSGSPTYLKWAAVELDGDTGLYIPAGCAHGFQALTEEVHLIYQHSAYYAPDAEGGVRFDDPALGISWPLAVAAVSDRDRSFPLIDDNFESIAL
jgi:dTDP-4-dehydrorhamnose 3,5-epimerase